MRVRVVAIAVLLALEKLEGDPNDPKSYEKYRGVDYAIDFMTREAVAWLPP